MAKSDLRVWAVKGAEQRLVEIAEEARAIFSNFPELRNAGRGFLSERAGRSSTAANGRTQANTPRRKKRTMSAAARKRIGDAQRARWAKQKAAQSTGTDSTTTSAVSSRKSAGAIQGRKKR